jgi:exosome complex RNA-binding protein Rrp42 (RNase PH superfamily)
MDEEACMMASVMVGVNKHGNICCVQKGGMGGVDPSSLYEMIEVWGGIMGRLCALLIIVLGKFSRVSIRMRL